MINRPILCLFASCIKVDGFSRATICDLQRNKYHLIPLSLSKLFSDERILNLSLTYKSIDIEHHEILDEYVKFLLEEELVFELNKIDEVEQFPTLTSEWDFPGKISNAIIDISEDYDHDFLSEFSQLENLGCRHVQIRFYKNISIKDLEEISNLMYENNFISIQCIFPYNENFIGEIIGIIESNIKFTLMIMYDSPFDKVIFDTGGYGVGKILSTKENITNERNCGCIHHKYFSVNIESFTESLNYNTCLNRKISIDRKGNLKNCPSMDKSFGHIDKTKMSEVTDSLEFKKLWTIGKNQINKCKDCEFRHICTDCRAYLDNPNDLLSAPLKCGYDPYECKWEDWNTNPLKKNAIHNYRF